MDYGVHMLSLMPTVNVLKGVTPQGEPYSLLIRNSDGCYFKKRIGTKQKGRKIQVPRHVSEHKTGGTVFLLTRVVY